MNLSWASLFYLVAIYGLIRYFAKPADDLNPKKINWTPVESVAVTIFIYFFGQLIGGLIVYSIPMLLGWSQSQINDWVSGNVFGQFLTILSVDAISVLLLVRFLRRRKNNFANIGFIKQVKANDFLYALGYYILYFLCFLVIVQLVSAFLPAVDIDQKQQIGFESVSYWKLPIVFISLVVLPAFVEELLVRSFLYGGLRQKMHKPSAAVLTSLIFALAHLQFGSGEKLLWIAAIDTFVLSLFLVALREKTGHIWSSIFLHGIKNSVAFVSLFILAVR